MKIVIAGAGEVGSHLAKMLGGSSHDITVIDESQELLDDINDFSDVVTVEGDPTGFSTLRKASVRKADLFIAVSPDENKNIISATLSKQMGAKKTIARIDDNEYLEPASKEIFINMGIDYLFYPEKLAAEEVVKLLGHTSSIDYVDFSRGRLALVVLRIDGTSPIVGKSLIEAAGMTDGLTFRTVAITRTGNTIIPRGEEVFSDGDTIYVITDRSSVHRVNELAGKRNIQVRNLMVFGGSRIGVQIAAALEDSMNVKLVEYNQEKAYRLAEILDNTLIINEDGRNIEAMLEEGIGSMDAFVAVTGRAETNILAAMIAKKMGVNRVIAEVENMNYIKLAGSIGIDTIINKKLITASNIFRFTMASDIQTIKYLTGTEAEVLEYIVKPNSPATKHPNKDLDFPDEAIIGGIVRGDKIFIGVGSTTINAYDRVVVFALPGSFDKIGRFFN